METSIAQRGDERPLFLQATLHGAVKRRRLFAPRAFFLFTLLLVVVVAFLIFAFKKMSSRVKLLYTDTYIDFVNK